MGVGASYPSLDQVEVSVFGPGFGECSIVHIGDDRWIVVDSCMRRGSKQPVALEYFQLLGVDTKRVELIVATHWHDDHIRGFSALVEACPNAAVCVSSVYSKQEFVESVLLHGDSRTARVSTGVSELRATMELLPGRRAIVASADKRILATSLGNGTAVEVWTLSPCDRTHSRFLESLCRLMPVAGSRRTRLPTITPNECSVVVQIKVGDCSVLLGADLEQCAPTHGWSEIVASQGRPTAKSGFFKVPHHGSKNADHEPVWREMLLDDPLFVVAPFDKGSKLPSPDDVVRLKAYGSRGFVTAVSSKKAHKRSGTVAKILKDMNINLTPIDPSTGHVRGRTGAGSDHFEHVELFSGAANL